jgi:YebC/PmpR family DNA-binding regulatory protein
MGRIFETRKATMFARWNRMAKVFTRIAKDIAIAVKAGGPSPEHNAALRRALQNARGANMPKDKVEAAIKRASGQDQQAYEVVLYEGYGPHGVAVVVETATDNVVRTVANVRMHFKDHGGNLGTTGSVAFQFQKMGVFRLAPEGIDHDALELDLIDHGLEEMGEGTGEKGEKQLVIRCAFTSFGQLQAALEERKLPVLSAESEYVAQTPVELPEEKAKEVLALVDALEQDDDVQRLSGDAEGRRSLGREPLELGGEPLRPERLRERPVRVHVRKVVEVGARDDHPAVGVLRLLAHPGEERRAVHAGEREVEQDHVRLEPRLEEVHRVLAVRRLHDEVALRLEPARDELAQLVLVLDDEDAGARLEPWLALHGRFALGGPGLPGAGLDFLGHSSRTLGSGSPRATEAAGRPYRPRSAR